MKHYKMTTEQATKELAKIWQYGGYGDAAMAIAKCQSHSRAWDWPGASSAMATAYADLGADAPEVPLSAIHRGEHPVQIAT